MSDEQAFEDGYMAALNDALRAIDGHGPRYTAHDRIRRLRACGECEHQPEKHVARSR